MPLQPLCRASSRSPSDAAARIAVSLATMAWLGVLAELFRH